jgi:hypothetical protein
MSRLLGEAKMNLRGIERLIVILAVTTMSLLAGCASTAETRQTSMQVKADVDQALEPWLVQRDYQTAVMRLHQLGERYDWGSEEKDRLTAIALIQLKKGEVPAFIQTANQLSSMIEPTDYINSQLQHVFTVAFAMQGKSSSELPGRGYDSSQVRVTYELLGK